MHRHATAKPLRKHSALVILTLALGTLAANLVGCHPQPGVNDPTGLTWDEDAIHGFHRLQKLEAARGIRVFWWNIMYGGMGYGQIDHNLQELVLSSAKPDVLAFGEFKFAALRRDTLDVLNAEYPFHTFAPYSNGTSEVGIAVWSTSQFQQSEPLNLDWTPNAPASSEEQDAFRQKWLTQAPVSTRWFDRPYMRLRWETGDVKLNLIAVHLLEPWDEVRSAEGRWGAWKEMVMGDRNPLYYQAVRLKEFMKADLGEELDREPALLIGDFNVPKTVLGLRPTVYKVLSDGMDEVFTGEPPTFPSFSSPDRQKPPFKYSMVKIDHGFVNAKAEALGAGVLPLRGSDHYPIYTVVAPKP